MELAAHPVGVLEEKQMVEGFLQLVEPWAVDLSTEEEKEEGQ